VNVFLGDSVTLLNDRHDEENPTFITGQIKGIVLNELKQVERVYLHNLTESLWMSDGWRFVDEEVAEDD
jgi:hypothetical protein